MDDLLLSPVGYAVVFTANTVEGPTPVREPGSLVLLGLGLAGFAALHEDLLAIEIEQTQVRRSLVLQDGNAHEGKGRGAPAGQVAWVQVMLLYPLKEVSLPAELLTRSPRLTRLQRKVLKQLRSTPIQIARLFKTDVPTSQMKH